VLKNLQNSYDEIYTKLCRIADLKNDILIPFEKDNLKKPEYDNINLIHSYYVDCDYKIGFWDWKYDEKKQYSYLNSNYNWIEFIERSDIPNLNQLKEVLVSGIYNLSNDHDFLIKYSSSGTSAYCLYVKGKDLVINKDLYKLNSNLLYLYSYKINLDDIYSINHYKLLDFKCDYYNKISMDNMDYSIEYLYSIQILISKIILKEFSSLISTTTKITRNEKQIFSKVLNNINIQNVDTLIEKQLNLNKEQVAEAIQEFSQNCHNFITETDLSTEIIYNLIQNNSRIYDIFNSEWEQQNQDKILDGQAELDKIKSNIPLIQQEIDNLETEKQVKLQEMSELDDKYNNLIQTGKEIEQKIQERIISAKENLSDFFAEFSMFSTQPQNNSSIQFNSVNVLKEPNKILENPEEITQIEDLIEYLSDNLENIGLGNNRTLLSSYLLSAYFNRIPLLIAGYKSDQIADALSAILNNSYAYHIYDKLTDFSLSDKIVAIHNQFDLETLIQVQKQNSYPLLIALISEEVSLQPKDTFSYAIPLFTEPFIESNISNKFDGYINNVDFRPDRKKKSIVLDKGFLSSIAYNNCMSLLSTANDLHSSIKNNISEKDEFALQIIPVMCSLNQQEKLSELMSRYGINNEDSTKVLVGV
jgi:hypothetical protein